MSHYEENNYFCCHRESCWQGNHAAWKCEFTNNGFVAEKTVREMHLHSRWCFRNFRGKNIWTVLVICLCQHIYHLWWAYVANAMPGDGQLQVNLLNHSVIFSESRMGVPKKLSSKTTEGLPNNRIMPQKNIFGLPWEQRVHHTLAVDLMSLPHILHMAWFTR